MEVEKPLADEVTDVLQAQHVLAEYGDPFRAAAADQLLDRFRTLQMVGLQAQQADITGSVTHRFQRTAVDGPPRRPQTGQQTVAVVTGVNH